MVMASQFESLMHPFIIMFTFPLAVIGVIWILLLAGKTFSVVTFVGVIILAGIAVNNGIVLIDYVNQLRARGLSRRDALVEGGTTRIRPVLITAGTTIVGMLPMALSTSEGAEMRGPMALTVIGGLFSATMLTLFVIPVMYQALDEFGGAVKAFVKRLLH
jgi:HAE1 family hydrophobic/amphiphilic exporter-1